MNRFFLIAILAVFSACKQEGGEIHPDASLEERVAKEFHEKISGNKGFWVNQINDTSSVFREFIMEFELGERDTLRGTIYGLHNRGDTILFWRIKEYWNSQLEYYYTEQSGPMGHTAHRTFFVTPLSRKAEFTMQFIDSTTRSIRDEHLFLNDSTLISRNEVFDQQSETWIKQPVTTWRKSGKE